MSKFKQTLRIIEEGLLKPMSTDDIANIKQEMSDEMKAMYNAKIGKIMQTASKNSDGTYDVDGDVDLEHMTMDENALNQAAENPDFDYEAEHLKYVVNELPITFRKVTGYFSIANNDLTTLVGSPREVGANYLAFGTNIQNLIGSPEKVGGSFDVSENYNLTSLEGAPKEVAKNFYISESRNKFTEDEIRKIVKVGGKVVTKGF